MKWFRAHPEGTLWIVWLGGGAILAGLIVAIREGEVVDGSLSLAGWFFIILLSVGYLATLIKVCNWVLEEKAQDRSIMWAFLIAFVGGIFPIIVALFGRNNTIIKVSGKYESASDFEIRKLVEREKDKPLDKGQISAHALELAREHFNRALQHESMNEIDKAIAEHTKAIELHGRYAMAYYNRGMLLVKDGKKGKARADLQKVISLAEGTELADMARRSLQELEAYDMGK